MSDTGKLKGDNLSLHGEAKLCCGTLKIWVVSRRHGMK